jgi:hypothetical protein
MSDNLHYIALRYVGVAGNQLNQATPLGQICHQVFNDNISTDITY